MGDWLIPLVTALIGAVAGVFARPLFDRWLARRSASDREQLKQWQVAFDRGAFQGPFDWHTDRAKHQEAIAQTIKAINTGVMGSESSPHTQLGGKRYLRNKKLRETMSEVEQLLRQVRSEAEAGVPGQTIDERRDLIIATMNAIWSEHHLEPLKLPTAFASTGMTRSDE